MLNRKLDDLGVAINFELLLRERGKVVPGSLRAGHNVFTDVGRGWLTRLIAWNTIGGSDSPFTERRVRWVSLGSSSQEETAGISAMVAPLKYDQVNYLAALSSVEFPDYNSARFIRAFGTNELNQEGSAVIISEAGLFADVNPADASNPDDVPALPGTYETVLNPVVSSNSPIAYKSFEPLTKTQDYSLEIQWELRFV